MIARTLHRAIRRVLPRAFRERFGPEMEAVFLEALDEARRRGRLAVIARWGREILDVAIVGRRLRADARRDEDPPVVSGGRRRKIGRFRGGAPGVLDDLRFAARSLVRRPSFTLFAVATVALGLGATTAMFSAVESVVLNPLPFESGDRMVGIFRRFGNSGSFVTPTADDLSAWRGQTDIFEALEPWTGRSMTLTGLGEAREVEAAVVRPGYSDFVGWSPVVGRGFTDDDAAGLNGDVLLLSHGFAIRSFGSPEAALGELVQLNGRPWTVIGVAPAGVLLPGWGLRSVDVWRPMTPDMVGMPMPALGVLREGISVDQANERFANLASAAGQETSQGYANLVREQVAAGVGGYLGLLMGAVVLLLLIACVNVSNLLLFRADARRRETAVRAALGGGRARLVRQLLIESLLLAGLGGACGVAVSYVGQAAILRLRPEQLEVLDYVSFNGAVWAFAFGITVLAGLLFGLLPALQASHPDALAPLRSGTRSEGDVVGRRMRWLLVSGEVGLSFALLLGAFGVFSTLIQRQRIDPGFAADEVAVVSVEAPGWRYDRESGEVEALFRQVLMRLESLPGVARASMASGAPTRAGVLFGRLQVEGRDPVEGTQVLHGPYIRPGYFETLGQEILRGRGFTDDDMAGEEELIILGEETARRFFADRDPVGARLRLGDEEAWRTVVGVSEDVAMTGLSSANSPLQIYYPQRDLWGSATFILRAEATSEASQLLPTVRTVVRDVEPDLRIDALGVGSDLLRDTLEREQFATTIMAVFASLALLLAAVGLYGVVSQVVGQRTREIGIRFALGAQRRAVTAMVLRGVGGATGVGVALGLLLAWVGGRVLDSQIYGFEAFDAWTYGGSAAALVLTALLAAYAPARRASRVDPVTAMRVE